MQALQRGVIDLVKACLTQEKADIVADFDWAAAYQIGREHGILPMLYYGVVYSGVQIPAEWRDRLRVDTLKSVMQDQNQLGEVAKIECQFLAHGIAYLPLKGMVMKHRYPHTEVRMMGDADILIREEQYDKIRPIMQGLGFRELKESNHELIWDKPGLLYVELHKRLIPSYNKDYYAYYGDGWKLARKTDTTRYEMRSEDEFIYLFTHYAKHYRDGGIGIRQVADLFVYVHTSSALDIQYMEAELRKLCLYDFYRNTMDMVDVWFRQGKDSDMTDFLTDRIFTSGAFGTSEKRNLSSGVKDAASMKPEQVKWQRMLKLIFPSAARLKKLYPVLEKYPFVLPLVWCHRWVKTLLFKRSAIQRNITAVGSLTAENIMKHKGELNYVGLDFNFGEK